MAPPNSADTGAPQVKRARNRAGNSPLGHETSSVRSMLRNGGGTAHQVAFRSPVQPTKSLAARDPGQALEAPAKSDPRIETRIALPWNEGIRSRHRSEGARLTTFPARQARWQI